MEARYVGNHVVGAYRAFDFNQVEINENGFLADFLRAQNNGFLALARPTATFNPAYNANLPGSQPLTVFPQTRRAASCATATSGQPDPDRARPANSPRCSRPNGLNGGVQLLPESERARRGHADQLLQLQLQLAAAGGAAPLRNGLTFEANYTFSKVLSDGDGDLQTRFQAFLDFNNPGLERSRANFDLNHMIKAFGHYELPFGKGHRLSYRPLDRVIGGWTVSQHDGVAVGRAVLDSVRPRHAEPRSAVVLQHRRHQPDEGAARPGRRSSR